MKNPERALAKIAKMIEGGADELLVSGERDLGWMRGGGYPRVGTQNHRVWSSVRGWCSPMRGIRWITVDFKREVDR